MVSKGNFGLPLEYQVRPEWFDAHNIREDTEAKNSVLVKILNAHSVRSVADLTCGTGSQVFHLSDKGFDVVGSDFSSDLLDIARKKAKIFQKPIQFVDGDMRSVQLGTFDAVITMFNAIGHVNRDEFGQVLKNVRQNLNTDGLYIFDIFNLQAMDEVAVSDLDVNEQYRINDAHILQIQTSQINHELGLMTSTDHYSVGYDDGRREEISNTFTLQIYTADEIKNLLNLHGFELDTFLALDGSPFYPARSQEILTVARATQ